MAGKDEPLLTRFHIFEYEDDEHGGPWSLRYLGTHDARDRDAALRGFLGHPVREIEGRYAAISENALKLRDVKITPRATFSDVPVPVPVAETLPV